MLGTTITKLNKRLINKLLAEIGEFLLMMERRLGKRKEIKEIREEILVRKTFCMKKIRGQKELILKGNRKYRRTLRLKDRQQK